MKFQCLVFVLMVSTACVSRGVAGEEAADRGVGQQPPEPTRVDDIGAADSSALCGLITEEEFTEVVADTLDAVGVKAEGEVTHRIRSEDYPNCGFYMGETHLLRLAVREVYLSDWPTTRIGGDEAVQVESSTVSCGIWLPISDGRHLTV